MPEIPTQMVFFVEKESILNSMNTKLIVDHGTSPKNLLIALFINASISNG